MRKIAELMSLHGRVAIVTGGAGHIGSTICEALSEAGASVCVLDIDAEKCESVCKRIEGEYEIQTLPLEVDLAKESRVREVPVLVERKFGRIDILVNCAAYAGTSKLEGWTTSFLEQKSESWRQALEVNLTAAFILTQACVPAMKATGNASVVNIGSIYGVVGPDLRVYEGTRMGNPAAYAASKGGLIQLTRWLATVLAPEIRVNALSAGGIWRNQDRVFHGRYKERTPLNRMGTEEDLKGGVIFLASDMSSYVTGQNLLVDGGWTAW